MIKGLGRQVDFEVLGGRGREVGNRGREVLEAPYMLVVKPMMREIFERLGWIDCVGLL